MDYVGPEPALGLSLKNIKYESFQWSVQEQNRRWCNIKSCRQAKQFMQVVNIRLTQYVVRLSRKDLRLLVGLLTGHNTLNRHLTLLRRIDDPLCPLCKEEEDTSLHLLGNCCAIAEKRCEFFGRYFLGPGDLRQVGAFFSGVQKPVKGFYNLRVNKGMHIEPAGGLSARQ